MATWNQMSLQDASSPIMQQMTFLHDHTMLIIVMITVLVGYLLIFIMFNKFTNRYLLEVQTNPSDDLNDPPSNYINFHRITILTPSLFKW